VAPDLQFDASHCLSTTLVFASMTGASEVFCNVMRYINLRFTYLLTYTPFQPSVRCSNSRIVLVVHVVVLLVAFGHLFHVQIDEVPKINNKCKLFTAGDCLLCECCQCRWSWW